MKVEPIMPDFSYYGSRLQTLSDDDLPFSRNNGRLIIIGDIHGVADSLKYTATSLDESIPFTD